MSSDVDIANLAMAKLGQQPIQSFLDTTTRAANINRTYPMLRDKLQRKRWNFNRAYVFLPVLGTAPVFEYSYAYQLPSDYLRLELAAPVQPVGTPPAGSISFAPPTNTVGMPGANLTEYSNSRNQDYRIVGLQIWTNIPAPLGVIYGKRVTDPTQFDSFFVESFAAYLAWQLCEQLTGSNEKKDALAKEFQMSISEAQTAKAIELPPEAIPDDTWMLARIAY
jgi:hypothetical protein